jgi:peptidylprolyl isomerase
MRNLTVALCLLASPVFATGLEIDVTGEAEGTIVIDLFEDVAPLHVERITTLAEEGAYDDVVFHRVIEGFMAQTGDVEYGSAGMDMRYAGRGGIGMARSTSPDSANSQFFIVFEAAPHLDGLYTIVGQVVEGMDVVDAIKLGRGRNGAVVGEPDLMEEVRVTED